MITIDNKTKIELFAVLGALPIAIGFVFWLSIIYIKSEASERINEKQDQKIEAQYVLLSDIRDRIIRIESNQNQNKEK